MKPVSSHLFNLSIVVPQEFRVERAEQERVGRERVERVERVERERVERERAERERLERQRAEQERKEQERVEQERVEQELLFRRLKPVETGYHRKFRCMDGTRQSLLNQTVDWVTKKSGQESVHRSNTYWFYG